MGLFKDIKGMKDTLQAVPDMVDEAQKMAANAQQYAAQQQAAAAAMQGGAVPGMPGTMPGAAPVPAPVGPDFEPIAGVSLETMAEVSKGLAAYNYDQSKAVDIAATKGISPDAWQTAMDGWNARIAANPAVAQRFNALYTGRA